MTFSSSVTDIGESGFAACALTSITIPSGVSSLGDYAFGGCSSLNSVCFTGNAPHADCTVFQGDPVTLFYLPDKTGWDSSPLPGCYQSAMWHSLIQGVSGSFGLQSNQFGFSITGPTNLPVIVQTATNLANPVWIPISTNNLSNGTAFFTDPEWSNFPARFYRLSPP